MKPPIFELIEASKNCIKEGGIYKFTLSITKLK
jgi:hypothetical protein